MKLDEDELKTLSQLNENLIDANCVLEEAKVELQKQANLRQRISLRLQRKYKLSENFKVDLKTGEISE